MYRVSLDQGFPYRLLGGQQDNSTVRIRSRAPNGWTIDDDDWEGTAGGESGHVVAKPDDPDIVVGGSYGGTLMWVDHDREQARVINVWPDDPMGGGAEAGKYRFQWNYPVFFSPHDPDRLYAAGNVLFVSTDLGQSWREISPDLTRAVPETLGSSGGPITQDNTSVEYYATIFAVAESPLQDGVLWAGSDDGLLHLSRDGGGTWTDVTPDWPEWMQVNSIEAHPFEPGGLYVAGTRYKSDDFRPYLYRTTDWGESWRKIDSGIPEDHFTRVIRADPERPGMLFAGTERGVYASFDDGATWRPFQLELPIVPITDLAIRDDDLVAATQGRGYWIVDDLAPLRQMSGETAAMVAEGRSGEPVLFEPMPTHRLSAGRADDPRGAGTNPYPGVSFFYALAEEPPEDAELRLEILDSSGEVVRTLTRKKDDGAGGGDDDDGPFGGGGGGDSEVEVPTLTAERGLNRATWDLHYPGAESFPGMVLWNGLPGGVEAAPGEYRARLTVGDWSDETAFRVLGDPRSTATSRDYDAQFAFQQSIREQLTRTHREIGRIRDVRSQLETFSKRLEARDEAPEVREAADALVEKLTGLEESMYQTKAQSPQDPLNYPIRLNDKLAGVLGMASLGNFGPTDSMVAVRDELVAELDTALADLQAAWEGDLAEVNRMAAEAGVDVVMLPPAEPKAPKEPEDADH
jgi:hypothetical protein